ncbi:MAG: 3-deoxy-manno-octulosonate cytidylyltransferase [Candidatus Omnitrophica bacterium]|nr:3-deoxy-manno-octulosonate cytidylyltransferase [Candidatus Omnitrophota bacterium]
MKVIGVIPARFDSTRFPGKVLADLWGKPIIQHVYERAKKATSLDKLIVATDNQRILKAVENFGGEAVLTSKRPRTGTDRVWEAVENIKVEVVVNIQGDNPLLHPSMIDTLASAILSDSHLVMATLKKKVTDREDFSNPNVVKIVTNKEGFALYFSRSPIPYQKAPFYFFKHIGLYAYRKEFLSIFTKLLPSSLEKLEGLEQLRALDYNYQIKTIETEYDTIEVDTPEDLEKIKKTCLPAGR